MLKHIRDRLSGKAPKSGKRSSKWRKVRKIHLKKQPRCAVCNGKKKIEVHHVIPFHVAPWLELDSGNLITLCERKKYGIQCHLLVGHLGNYRRVNEFCKEDAAIWRNKLMEGKP